MLPFQPYDRLPEVLGAADLLLVLLEADAGAFSVPSKTLSYLCAGRPILGFVPAENLAASLIEEAGGCVLPPEDIHVPNAAAWVTELLSNRDLGEKIGVASRELAVREFNLDTITDRFETILNGASR
jgi:glycosyltransferase involved in cell wall biosynthesis